MMRSMKQLCAVMAGAMILGTNLRAAETVLQPGDFVAVCGDSITEQRSYSALIEDYLMMCQPAPDLRSMCFGWNGETSWGFLKRVKNDVVPFKPNIVTICLGMNDSGTAPIDAQRTGDYRSSMDQIVKIFKDSGVRSVVVGTPGVVDTTSYTKSDQNVRNANLKTLAGIAKEVSEANQVGFADLNTVMRDVMAKAKAKYGPQYIVTGVDGVHPGMNGHLIMAYAFLKALGCEGDIGQISYDMASGKATATDGHKVLSSADHTIKIQSTRYPFCFTADAADSPGTRGISGFMPFNEELNRYILTVTGAPSKKLKVTWGKASKVFDSDTLAKGINLTVEFPETPFDNDFSRVNLAIREKENFDIKAVKSMQHGLLDWGELFPEMAGSYKTMTEKLVAMEKSESDKIRKIITPVQHTIVIEPAS